MAIRIMKYLSIISSIIILFSCNSANNQVEDPLVLDFPSISTYADSVIYLGCENIISIAPPSFNFEIYEDTIIDLHQFDDRLNLNLKFNWLYENYWDIGVTSIDVLKRELHSAT